MYVTYTIIWIAGIFWENKLSTVYLNLSCKISTVYLYPISIHYMYLHRYKISTCITIYEQLIYLDIKNHQSQYWNMSKTFNSRVEKGKK